MIAATKSPGQAEDESDKALVDYVFESEGYSWDTL